MNPDFGEKKRFDVKILRVDPVTRKMVLVAYSFCNCFGHEKKKDATRSAKKTNKTFDKFQTFDNFQTFLFRVPIEMV